MDVDKEQEQVIGLMTAYGCTEEKAREFVKHTEAFKRAVSNSVEDLYTQEQMAAELGMPTNHVRDVDAMRRAEQLPRRSNRMNPALAAPYGGGPSEPVEYPNMAQMMNYGQAPEDDLTATRATGSTPAGDVEIFKGSVRKGRWSGRVLPVHPDNKPKEEVTSELVKVASLVEFAGTKQGRQAIEEELARRAAEDNPKIRSADTKEGSRKQRREMARRMNKAIRKAKAAGVKR